jgi:hypothetical protein
LIKLIIVKINKKRLDIIKKIVAEHFNYKYNYKKNDFINSDDKKRYIYVFLYPDYCILGELTKQDIDKFTSLGISIIYHHEKNELFSCSLK